MKNTTRQLHWIIILGIVFITSIGFTSCGEDNDDDSSTETTTSPEFSAVNQIIMDHCGGSSCHGSGSSYPTYVDNETRVKSDSSKIINRVITLQDMPPSNATATQKSITEAERNQINSFLTGS